MTDIKNGTLAIPRKLWVALANDQLKRRERDLGKAFTEPCSTCVEILMCDGPIGKHLCSTINQMMDGGLLTGPQGKKPEKRRAKMLPISRYCLEAYGLLKPQTKPNSLGYRDGCKVQFAHAFYEANP